MLEFIKKEIKKAVGTEVDFNVSASEKEDFGHYSTNAAFKLAPVLKKSPMAVAKEIELNVKGQKSNVFSKVEAVAPGFINFWLKPEILQKELKEILKKKNKYGNLRSTTYGLRAQKINLEFVSANPTGPLTMANGRSGFYGDVLANVLENAGHKVTREYYINDTGNQIKLLGESILAVAGKIPWKEEYYQGDYIKKLKDKSAKQATTILLKSIKASLKSAGIKHDVWFSEEKNLHKKGELKKTLQFLEKKGLVEKKDGALWLGDGVLIKSDGNPTYFLADLAYHYDKFLKRKFNLAIDIWGADHHGYAQRMKKGIEALGVKPERLKILITQLVRLVSGGKEVKMSKRKGEFITLDELLKEVGAPSSAKATAGKDAARFFFLMHSLDTHMDFDLDLAKERSQKNPVYYAQYAYVRVLNILKRANLRLTTYDLRLLKSDSEVKLMLELVKLPDVLAQTAEDYQVHRLTRYATELAKAFHNFYEKERVIGFGDKNLEQSRLALVSATKIILENLFDILGISKLKKM
ncbi:MAG: arginine--tRNA ligase [Candidatus Harrisonbacteria bacterium]|nr:arginine--tRNA ligase [Candidatus Harrisonbacteria bacterium]